MKPSAIHSEFVHFLLETWALAPTDPEMVFKDNQVPLFSGRNDWMKLYCFSHPGTVSLSRIKQCLKKTPDTVLVFIHPDGESLDIYAQSALDISPIVIHELIWKNNSDLSSLIHLDSFLEFTFELDRKFGKRRLEQKFVSEFRKYYLKLCNAWKNLSDDTPQIRQQLSLDTMLRLFFVAFLSARGTLDNRSHFLMEEAQNKHEQNLSIYRDFLQPLFFETLNRSEHRRTLRSKELGNIPFLNGGLFTPSPIEKTSPELDVPNTLWLRLIHDLFEQYSLTPDKAGHSSCLTLDPMMLGHVFESLMAQKNRAATGSYYTPLPLARCLVLDVFRQWFKQEYSFTDEQAQSVCVRENYSFISPEKARQIDHRLAGITILDPAVGSGAFLQCALDILHRIRSGLKKRCGEASHPGQLARHILARNLFGVDIIPAANQLCELRLWLELISYFPQCESLPSLPNLDLNIQCGDTLTDLSQYAQVLGIELPKQIDQTAHLKHRYRLATGYTKKKLSGQIHEEMHQTGQKLFQMFVDACEHEFHIIEMNSRSLFGQKQSPSFAQRQRLQILNNHRQKLNTCLDSNQLPGFSFDIHFGDILSNGGFDIILGNPPWYSLHTLPEESQVVLRNLYKTALPVPGTHAQSTDISALFIEKSLQCLSNSGILNMLIPNKLFSAPSYEAFRNYLRSHATIIQLKDWSNAKYNAFAAATYPASLMLKRENSDALANIPDLNHAEESSHSPVPFMQHLSPNTRKISDAFTIKRGVCTGANHIFIGSCQNTVNPKDQNTAILFGHLQDAVPIESELIYPALRGANIQAYSFQTPQCLLFTHQWNNPASPLLQLPSAAHAWIAKHHNILKERKGLGTKPVHSLFGTSEYLSQMKVVWRDISQELNACFIRDPKVIPVNTVYYIPVQTEDEGYLLSAYLNSSVVRAFCRYHAEHARNDYRRYFAWVIGKLPWFLDMETYPRETERIIELSKASHKAQQHQLTELQNQIDKQIEACLSQPSQHTRIKPQRSLPGIQQATQKAG